MLSIKDTTNQHSSDQQLLTHSKFQVLTKLQILLRSEKREQQLDFKKIAQQISVMADKNLTTKGYSIIAYVLIRNRLARIDDIQNWIKLCCQGKEQQQKEDEEKLTIESKIHDE